tara:strand:- start:157 stop:384 length:228 start_codon:yes stop_codon:yes gene_type:complete
LTLSLNACVLEQFRQLDAYVVVHLKLSELVNHVLLHKNFDFRGRAVSVLFLERCKKQVHLLERPDHLVILNLAIN